ncbi:DUF6122 family protein [Flagellimonas lutaonensis]|uniref:Membrane protein n=1 Tax=Flagellimonas lutaonensis TaxID=516051 RepID=A0A0D5YQ12_9FLAO|nr:DUF6122 family protein [Allomuricauda lutaonensis]AKA33941.1 membrane protein [Allomuricauda lutaonensis]
MLRLIAHYGIHFLVPLAIGYFGFPRRRFFAIAILLSGILIDVDHLWANPIFDPDRCSIGFHFLHSYWAIGLYAILLVFRKTRIFGLALMLHILADLVDCLFLRLEL